MSKCCLIYEKRFACRLSTPVTRGTLCSLASWKWLWLRKELRLVASFGSDVNFQLSLQLEQRACVDSPRGWILFPHHQKHELNGLRKWILWVCSPSLSSFLTSTLPCSFSILACCISLINTQVLASDFNNPSCEKQVQVPGMLKIEALSFLPCHSQVRVSDGAPGPQREAVLSGAVVGHREVHADHLHPHRGPGLPAVRPDIFKTKVRRDFWKEIHWKYQLK